MSYSNPSKLTWAQNVERLRATFEKWGIGFEHFNIECEVQEPQRRNYREGWVRVQYRHPRTGSMVTMQLDTQRTASKNLNAIANTVEDLRMQEVRGLSSLAEAHYLALAAPNHARDPYEVLGLRPDASLEDAEEMYKARAKRAHPDVEGGSDEAMAEFNAAIEALRGG